jgi:tryptophanyl-tRNA synthetase
VPRVFSGIKPTGEVHLGNLLGALRNWVSDQDTHDCVYCVVDLHSITVEQKPDELRRNTLLAYAQLLAAGVDPDRSTLFVQSHVPEHTQLGWVMQCITGYGEASRMTQFKDKSARGAAASVGLFTYPVLQAADILLYQADGVPIGEDQRQHLELTRTLAQRFNTRFGSTFTVPEPWFHAPTAKILDLADPTAKMSKSASSAAGVLDLLDEPTTNVKKIRSAVTDTGTDVRADPAKPGVTNLMTILGALTGRSLDDIEQDFVGRGYGDLKATTAEAFVEAVQPFRQRALALLDDPEYLQQVLAEGAGRACAVAETTLAQTYERIGFLPRKA